jgi:hypothetical protein
MDGSNVTCNFTDTGEAKYTFSFTTGDADQDFGNLGDKAIRIFHKALSALAIFIDRKNPPTVFFNGVGTGVPLYMKMVSTMKSFAEDNGYSIRMAPSAAMTRFVLQKSE